MTPFLTVRERKAALAMLGISNTAIARKLGISQSAISRVLHDVRDTPRVQQAIAAAIGKPVSAVFRPRHPKRPVK